MLPLPLRDKVQPARLPASPSAGAHIQKVAYKKTRKGQDCSFSSDDLRDVLRTNFCISPATGKQEPDVICLKKR